MNTFLKIVLILLATVIAVKLLPLTLAIGCVIGAAALIILAVGISAAAVIVCFAALLAAALAPVWLPVLAGFAIVALVRRSRRPAPTVAAAA